MDVVVSESEIRADGKPEKITGSRVHFCQSLEGAVRNWTKEQWDEVGKDNRMTGDGVKERFRIWIFEGKKVIPFGEPCEGFSYQTGCPGHPIEDDDDQTT